MAVNILAGCSQVFDLRWWIHDFTGTESGAGPCKAHVILTMPIPRCDSSLLYANKTPKCYIEIEDI